MHTAARLLAVLLLLGLLTACGQKGPLTLPESQESAAVSSPTTGAPFI